jgi:predicted  nucleic acid-binding Zn-ribbon protein
VASPAYEQILEIQRLDLALTQLRHRHANHPLRTELAAASAEAARLEALVAGIEGRYHELERNLKRLSDEVATIEAKRAGIDGKLYGGRITASKELVALQDEGTSLLERQRGLEDDELEIMEQQEELQSELASGRAEFAGATQAAQRAETALAESVAGLESELGELQAERARAVGSAMPELLARYEELAPQFGGMPLARLVNGRCDGCHIQLSAMAVDQLSRAAEDAVVTCEECGRLLVR